MGDLVEAAVSGNKLATLVALRNCLAEEIEQTTSGRDLAALSRQLTDVLNQIADLPNGEESSAADEIAKRREERRNTGKQVVLHCAACNMVTVPEHECVGNEGQ